MRLHGSVLLFLRHGLFLCSPAQLFQTMSTFRLQCDPGTASLTASSLASCFIEPIKAIPTLDPLAFLPHPSSILPHLMTALLSPTTPPPVQLSQWTLGFHMSSLSPFPTNQQLLLVFPPPLRTPPFPPSPSFLCLSLLGNPLVLYRNIFCISLLLLPPVSRPPPVEHSPYFWLSLSPAPTTIHAPQRCSFIFSGTFLISTLYDPGAARVFQVHIKMPCL